MKTSIRTLRMWIVGVSILAATGIVSSCSKKSSGTTTPPPPVGPTNPGGYDSSEQIQTSALLDYWTFNGNLTDSKGALSATNDGATFSTGMLSGTQAFQGSSTGYAVITNPGSSLPAMQSFTISVWINSAQIAKGGPEESFFQLVDSTQWQSNIHLGVIPATSTDSLTLGVKLQNWPGDTVIPWQTYYLNAYLDTAVGKWTHVVVTYSGSSSILNVYENGTVIPVNGPYTSYPGYTGLELFQNDPGTPPTGGTPNSNPNSAKPWGNVT